MQIICTLLPTDNQASTSSLNFFMGQMLFLTPNERFQSTEGRLVIKISLPGITGNNSYSTTTAKLIQLILTAFNRLKANTE